MPSGTCSGSSPSSVYDGTFYITKVDDQTFTYSLTNTTWFRARITDGRDVRTVLRGFGREGGIAGLAAYLQEDDR